jgi:hypothetical protein
MKYKIAGLGIKVSDLQFRNIDLFDFSSKKSALSYDILIIDLNGIESEYSFKRKIGNEGIEYFNGAPMLNDIDSYTIESDIDRRKQEIIEFWKSGKTVIIIPPERNLYAVQIRNGLSEKIIDLLTIIPLNITFHSGAGSEISYYQDNLYESLFTVKNLFFEYYYYLDSKFENTIDLAVIPGTDKVIAKDFICGSGHLIVLPLDLNHESYQNDKSYRDIINRFLKTIDNFQEELKFTIEDFKLPYWTNNYPIFDEKEVAKEIDTVEKQISKLSQDKVKYEEQLENIQKYKLVLTSSGQELENIITQIFIEIGFKIKETDYNRADGIFEYKDKKLVVEIKGVSKSASEKHAAQLEKWVAEYIEKNSYSPKPMLIVNGFRQKELSKRIEAVFPKQMINYSTKRDHCLISTTQLLCLFIEIKSKQDIKESLIQELIATVGVYNRYKNPIDFLSQKN